MRRSDYLCNEMNTLNQHIEQIRHLCESNKVKSLFAFGSVTNDSFHAESDIDLIVEIEDTDPFTYSDHYFELKFKLQDLLNRQIDLLEHKAIRNTFFRQQVESSKVLLYEK
jgi:uncharacterized protein